jgi:D-alanine-D-alanine ligase
MRVGLTYDLKDSMTPEPAGPEDASEEYDSEATVSLIGRALESGGHTVTRLGGGREFLTAILASRPDIVFNIAEGRGTHRSREAQVPSVLEMLDIPYSGSDPQCLAITLDKPLTKKLAAAVGVPTPAWRVITNPEEAVSWEGFTFPAILKPAYEGSSKGIRLTSLAQSPAEAAGMAARLMATYGQPVMVEEFMKGDEVTVGIIGNSPPKIVGIMRVLPHQKEDHFIYSLEVKRDWQRLVDYECPARFEGEVTDRITEASLAAFTTLGCRDFARLDFRVAPSGVPYFIEINPLPGLGTHSDLIIMALKLGWRHEAVINAVLDAAIARYPKRLSVC